jgi:hypothetical protein
VPELLPVLLSGVVLLELPVPRLPLAPLLLVLPLAPLDAPEVDRLKYASHSEREICPSLFVSTDEKLGVEALLLVPPDAAGEDDELDEPVLGKLDPLEVLPEAAGEEVEEPLLMPLLLLPPVLLPDELCPAATPDSANNAAAVAMLTNFRFNIGWIS